jgi:uncharacterized membrane protein
MARSNGSSAAPAPRRPRAHKPSGASSARNGARLHRPGRNVLAVAAMERAGRAERTRAHRVVCRVAAWSGSIPFLWLQLVGIAAWIAFNSWPGLPHIDPFPYVLLTLVLSIEAIFLSVFILISQNEETRLTERRDALDLQINLLAEQEGTQALRMLHQIGAKLGVQFDVDAHIKELERATRPDALAEEIDAIAKRERERDA